MRSRYPTDADSDDTPRGQLLHQDVTSPNAGTDFFHSQMSWSTPSDPFASVIRPPHPGLLAQAGTAPQQKAPPNPSINRAHERQVARDSIKAALLANKIKFKARVDWHALLPKQRLDDDLDLYKPGDDILFYESVVIHHAGSSYSCSENAADEMMRAQKFDMQDSWWDWFKHKMDGNRNPPFDDIGYHYGVSCAGEVYEGRIIGFKGAHVESANTHKIGIVILTSLTTDNRTAEMKNTTAILVDVLRKNLPTITRLGGHREFLPGHTECPGDFGIELVKELRQKSGLRAP